MKPNELYKHICEVEYRKSGFDLDWCIEVDDKEEKIRMLFQPTTTNKDWFINFAGFIPVFKFPLFFCWGWKKVFDGCKNLIMSELIRNINQYSNYTVEICGHSYGGAISTIAGIELYKQTKIRANIITFGSPRPLFFLWSKFVSRLYLGNVKYYAHRSDIVTYCPPLIGFHNPKTTRLGKFSLKNLFDPYTFHTIYSDASIYPEE